MQGHNSPLVFMQAAVAFWPAVNSLCIFCHRGNSEEGNTAIMFNPYSAQAGANIEASISTKSEF